VALPGVRVLPSPVVEGIILIIGIQAAGKSTVAQALAARLPRSVHLRGDLFRRMIVSGRAEPTASMSPGDEADRQLRLRYRLTALAADEYAAGGFTVVAQDNVYGDHLTELTAAIRTRPLHVVALVPHPSVVAAREAGRGKVAYGAFTVADLDAALRERTPHIGLWLDTSDQTPEETVTEILSRAPVEAAVP
jgi:predicted kinase